MNFSLRSAEKLLKGTGLKACSRNFQQTESRRPVWPWSSEGRAEFRTMGRKRRQDPAWIEKDPGLVGEDYKKPRAASPTPDQSTCLLEPTLSLPWAQSPPAQPPSPKHSLLLLTLGLVRLQSEPALLLLGYPQSLDVEHHLEAGQRQGGLCWGHSGLFLAHYRTFKGSQTPAAAGGWEIVASSGESQVS